MKKSVFLLIFSALSANEFIFWAQLTNKNFILHYHNEAISPSMVRSENTREVYICDIFYTDEERGDFHKNAKFSRAEAERFGQISRERENEKSTSLKAENSVNSTEIPIFVNSAEISSSTNSAENHTFVNSAKISSPLNSAKIPSPTNSTENPISTNSAKNSSPLNSAGIPASTRDITHESVKAPSSKALPRTALGAIDDDMPKKRKLDFLNAHKDELLACFDNADIKVQDFVSVRSQNLADDFSDAKAQSFSSQKNHINTQTFIKILPIRFRIIFALDRAVIFRLYEWEIYFWQ